MAQPIYPPAEAPIAVVGPLFSKSIPVDLILRQKFISVTKRDFAVKDGRGDHVFSVKGVLFNLRERRLLEDAAGNTLITMQEKLLTAHKRWKVFRGESTDDSDLLFSVKKSHILQLRTRLDVFLAGNIAETSCDFRIEGNLFRKSCTVYHGDSSAVLAKSKKQGSLKNVLGKDSFCVTIYPNVDQAFVVALILALDEIN